MWIDAGLTGWELYNGFRRAGVPCLDARVVREASAEEPLGVGALALRQVGPPLAAVAPSRDGQDHLYKGNHHGHQSCLIIILTHHRMAGKVLIYGICAGLGVSLSWDWLPWYSCSVPCGDLGCFYMVDCSHGCLVDKP